MSFKHSSAMAGRLSVSLWTIVVVLLLLGVSLLAQDARPAVAEPVDVGYRDVYYGGLSAPTGEKPESKLWFNDGFWWASLYNKDAEEFRIYRLNLANQTWVDTGTALDNRKNSKADVLWDDANQKLYVVSHVFTNSGSSASESQRGKLYRYSYNKTTKTYSLDSGFPVTVTGGKSETLTVAKDSTGKLWVTYVESKKVMINHSKDDDRTWAQPFVLPTSDTTVDSDDISSIIAFGGNKIGVAWSNQSTKKVYFAVHRDGDPENVWQQREVALPGPGCPSGSCADDHLNIKSLHADGSGRVFIAIKTSLESPSSAPLVMLLVRSQGGGWAGHIFGRVSDQHTRPIVLLDEEHGRIYMFATAPESGGAIYYKSSDINSISFPSGRGDLFIKNSGDSKVNNATSTKQNVNSTTGLVVMASGSSGYYYHNYLSLGGGLPPTATNVPPTATNVPPTATNVPPTATNVPPTVTSVPPSTPTPDDAPTGTSTPDSAPTGTSTPDDTPPSTPTPDDTPTNTPTPDDAPTGTSTPDSAPTGTSTPDSAPTGTFTPDDTPTSTPTPGDTPTNTPTPVGTPVGQSLVHTLYFPLVQVGPASVRGEDVGRFDSSSFGLDNDNLDAAPSPGN